MTTAARLELTPTETPARPSFYRPELDVVRFFAFLMVFIHHTLYHSMDELAARHMPSWATDLYVSVARAGAYGVDLFFVLSAYLITEILFREKEGRGSVDVKSFYIRRMLRIWPLYYFFVLLAALVPFLNPQHAFSLKYVLPFLLLAGNWSTIAYGPPNSVAVPLWSVSIEEQFYLLWPPIVARLSRPQIAMAAGVMIVLANGARVFALLLKTNTWDIWANSFVHLDSMAAGILLAIFLRGGAPKLGWRLRLSMIVLGVFCIALVGHFSPALGASSRWGATLVGYPVVGASCAAIVFASIGVQLRLRALEYLGKISYGLYVYHLMCIWIAGRFLLVGDGALQMLMRQATALGLTILVSAVSYSLLEKPFLKLKRKFAYVQSRPV